MKREAELQDKLKDIIEALINRKFRFSGVDIKRVERDWPVNNRKVDLALLMRNEIPFMFIETKLEGKERGSLFHPLSASIVGQVMTYAAIYKRAHPEQDIPFVATATEDGIAFFRVPKDIKGYIDWEAALVRDYAGAIKHRYRSILDNQMVGKSLKLSLTEEFVNFLLEGLGKEYIEKRIIQSEPTEALIDRFRDFVEKVAERCAPLLEYKLKKDNLFQNEVEKLGYKLDTENFQKTATNLARMMAYVLMNKIIFRKILEGSYGLPHLVSLDSSSRVRFMDDLERSFNNAIEATKDFEPIFRTGIYDLIQIPEDTELMEFINQFIIDLEVIDVTKIGDRIGYMYEILIPPEERHQLGQFYTPPWVCELISRWCVRSSEDKILDPGVGSGGFVLNAYKVLQEEKIGERITGVPRETHERILNQLYALDINAFPAHITAMNLSMRHVKVPSTKLNVVVTDFFSVQPGQKAFTPYKLRSIARGEEEVEIIFPKFDAVIGNPPYTRWTEIPDDTQELIRQRLGKLMKEYRLTPQVSRGVEPGIYTYWIMHATDFLEDGGRLGMIISNTWLQTDYGIGFGDFLLDNFRIKAIIDTALKLFKGALVTTCIVLAEREGDEAKRLDNDVAFIHIPGEVESADVEGLLEAVEIGSSKGYVVTVVKQRELPRDRKWIDMFFKTVDISDRPLMTKLGELFEPLRGNTSWAEWALSHGRRPDPGSSDFHYLSPSKIKEHELDKWAYPNAPLRDALVYPAITSARQTNFFTFAEEDWEEMRRSDDKCYMFMGHRPKEKLPREVADYIRWGETECRAKGGVKQIRGKGRLASETEAAKARAKEIKRFYGWYDLGGEVSAPVFAIRYGWYKSRFVKCDFPLVMCDNFIALVPKRGTSLNQIQVRALLAYLNSSFSQYSIESKGRKTPGGAIALEANVAGEMPILDIKKLNDKQLNSLAKLFDELERDTRKIGGASRKEEIKKLKPKIYEIDRAVAALLDIKDKDIKNVEAQVDRMVERRVSAAK